MELVDELPGPARTDCTNVGELLNVSAPALAGR